MDTRSEKSISRHKEMHSGTANGNRTKTQRRADNVSLRSQRGGKRSPSNGKGLAANTNLLLFSLALQALAINYNSMEKVVLALVHATRRLRRPRTSIRGQVLADFIAERPDEGGPSMEVQTEEAVPEPWILFTDESSCLEGSGAGLILTSPEGEEFTYALRFEFDASNNEAKYEALIVGLRIAEQIGVKNLIAKVDSRLVANQINGLYEAKEQRMTQYLENDSFKKNSIEQVPRSENKKADTLSKITSTSFTHLIKQVLWGIDISGPFPEAQGKVKFLFVASDYFTKWIEAKLVATITGNQVKKFVWDNIHPQSNGQVERANRSLGEGIKARIDEDNGNWVKEVPHVLWAHRTMIKTSNGDTPFSLTYGTKAMILVEIRIPSIRCAELNQTENNERLLLNLDILEERREKEAVRKARSKAKMKKYYNAKVRSTSFRPGDFVYRSNEARHAKESGKLGPKWEGPYEVVEALRKGAYKLRNRSGDVPPRTWNV
ncbi:reverse transcriptase domain-containing protein [Tanacetum coccineum]